MKFKYYLIFSVLQLTIIFGQIKEVGLDELVKVTIKNNPAIKIAEHKLTASESEIAQSSNLPDPVFTFGIMNLPLNSFSFHQEPMTGKLFSLSQSFPFPGKLSEIGDVKSTESKIAGTEINSEKLSLQEKITNLYYNYFYLQRIDNLIKLKNDLLERLSEVVRTKYEVSAAGQQNIFKVQLEISNVETDRIEIQNNLKNVFNSISVISGIPADSLVLSDNNHLDADLKSEFNPDSLYQIALQNRPEITKSQLAIDRSQQAVDLADYTWYPNFTVTLQYSQRDRITNTADLPDFGSVMLGMNIPLNYGGKKSAEEQYAKAGLDISKSNREKILQDTKTGLIKLSSKLNSEVEQYKIVNGTKLKLAEFNYSAALSDYQNNKIDFSDTIDAVNEILKVRKNIFDLRLGYFTSAAEIEKLTGTGLFTGETK